jgi:hypothetical protein
MSVPDVPASSELWGNSISQSSKISPSKNWCFTLNNYSEDEYLYMCSKIKEFGKCGFIGKEVGEQGTPHLQGFVEFQQKNRFFTVFQLLRDGKIPYRCFKCKGTKDENWNYCCKDDKSPFVHNYHPQESLIIPSYSELYPWQRAVVDHAMEKPDMRSMDWYVGRRGCGKTSIIKYLCHHHDACLCNGVKLADMQYAIVDYCENNDGRTPRLIVIPLWFRTDTSTIDYDGLESIKDMCFRSGKYKGGTVIGNPPHLFVFANEEPDYNDEKLIVHTI